MNPGESSRLRQRASRLMDERQGVERVLLGHQRLLRGRCWNVLSPVVSLGASVPGGSLTLLPSI